MNYYNEFDPQAAAWLRALIADGQIPFGIVDERSIEDVEPRELEYFTQCHFFAGIGGWPLALKLAGWPEDRRIWTGSCPCQPFSAAGKGNGFDDERHLWPAFHWLIEQCRPAVVLGEQVASAAVGPWIDLVLTDLEALGYASGAYAGPAAGVGAPHIRDRSYWVGYANDARPQGHAGHDGAARREGPERSAPASGVLGGLANSDVPGQFALLRSRSKHSAKDVRSGQDGGPVGYVASRASQHDGLRGSDRTTGPTNGHWRAADWLACRDGKWRPVEPGTFPLAHGVSGRVGLLRGYGNAIVPQQAAQFLQALM